MTATQLEGPLLALPRAPWNATAARWRHLGVQGKVAAANGPGQALQDMSSCDAPPSWRHDYVVGGEVSGAQRG